MSLNSQSIVVLDGIICFSVRYFDNLLLVFKMRFQVSKRNEDFAMKRRSVI